MDKPVFYDPTKPINREIKERVEQTWVAAKDWGIDIRRQGKRVVLKEQNRSPWASRTGFVEKMQASDGIGTKGYLHWLNKSFRYAAQDAFAMVVDDIIESGFVTFQIQDIISVGSDDKRVGHPAILGVVDGLVELAKTNKVIISGGETAIKNTVKGLEVDITGTGVRIYESPTGMRQDSVLIGLKSSGFHSNGFTVINELYRSQLSDNPDRKLLESLTTPTTIYAKELAELYGKGRGMVHGTVHITGGGWAKFLELDPKGQFGITVTAPKPKNPIFIKFYEDSAQAESPITPAQMYRYFNCGLGFVVAVDEKFKDEAFNILRKHEPTELEARIEKGGSAVNVIDNVFSEGQTITV
ncbi:MAG TPA: AIR synthase-related protein [Candidatus Baltobacteraceae bacterium]|nr:AIR synthase-related protein [Candidatus Baltobacteraceae bacterium]